MDEQRKKELTQCIQFMSIISSSFYSMAVMANNHSFIEFCGLMNEYIAICRDSLNKGIDFSMANTHTEEELHIEKYRIDYINEKLECIFQGLSFASVKSDN